MPNRVKVIIRTNTDVFKKNGNLGNMMKTKVGH